MSELMTALDGQVPDGVQIKLDTSVGRQIDAGVVGNHSGGGLATGDKILVAGAGLGLGE